eukprot:GEMP01043901.1.p1 GENE.GEMP01043901.1~~GEMP01043901.1.p1  ORF type:complete len:212 (+),score=47.99 GEMP01043901.1:320-955(+)
MDNRDYANNANAAAPTKSSDEEKQAPPTVLIIQQPDATFGFATSKDYIEVTIESPAPLSEFGDDNNLEVATKGHLTVYFLLSLYLFFYEGTIAVLFYISTDAYVLRVSQDENFDTTAMSLQTLKAACRAFAIVYGAFIMATFLVSWVGSRTRSPSLFDHLGTLTFICCFIHIFMAPLGHFTVFVFGPRFVSVIYVKFLRVLLLRREFVQGL